MLEYANTLHTEHGKNLGETMTRGQKLDVTPIDTAAVDKLRVKGAGQLAELVPLEGQESANAYLRAMVAGHTEALEMIDTKPLKTAKNDAVKKHLTAFRGHVASHLEKAKQLLRHGVALTRRTAASPSSAAPGLSSTWRSSSGSG